MNQHLLVTDDLIDITWAVKNPRRFRKIPYQWSINVSSVIS